MVDLLVGRASRCDICQFSVSQALYSIVIVQVYAQSHLFIIVSREEPQNLAIQEVDTFSTSRQYGNGRYIV
jgi:hypothetical protein